MVTVMVEVISVVAYWERKYWVNLEEEKWCFLVCIVVIVVVGFVVVTVVKFSLLNGQEAIFETSNGWEEKEERK